jgi:hydrogenase nickel incorporation protein HypB
MSVAEGDEKPLKYRGALRAATGMVLTKIDLVPHLDFSAMQAIHHARSINPNLRVFPISCYTGEGMNNWAEWLTGEIGWRAELRRSRGLPTLPMEAAT